MTQKKAQKLDLNWEELFPGDVVDIKGCKITIEPLGLKDLAMLTRKLKAIGGDLAEAGVSWENYSDPASMVTLASVVLEKSPDIIAEASGIVQADIERLPLEIVVQILTAVLNVNTKSKSVLEKNFASLATTLTDLMKPTLAKSSKS